MFLDVLLLGQARICDSLKQELREEIIDSIKARLYILLWRECGTQDKLLYGESALGLVNKLIKRESRPEKIKDLLKLKTEVLGSLAYYYLENNDTARTSHLYRKQLEIFNALSDSNNIIQSQLNIAYCYRRNNNIPLAREYLRRARAQSGEMKFKAGEMRVLGTMANFFTDAGDYEQAITSCEEVIKIAKEERDTGLVMTFLTRIGDLYGLLGNLPRAENCLLTARNYFEKTKNSIGLRNSYAVLGFVYSKNNHYEQAISSFKNALSVAENRSNPSDGFQVRSLLSHLSEHYFRIDSVKAGLKYARLSLKAAVASKDSSQLTFGRKTMAYGFFKAKMPALAKRYIEQSLSGPQIGINADYILEAEELAYKIDSVLGDSYSALHHYRRLVELRDKMKSDELIKGATSEKMEWLYAKQQMAEKAEQEKRDLAASDELRWQQTIRNTFVIGFGLVMIIIVVVLRSYRQKQLSNKELAIKNQLIEEKNRDITDSINYAKRIQTAKLPDLREISVALPQSFVLYKPKDIVSGDFYFLHRKNGHIYLAAGDCTGHGVPGAFMSLIAQERLDDALVYKSDAAGILSHLNRGVKASLRQSDGEDSTRDGLDIALCVINMAKREVEFAGANRPLWVLRNDSRDIEEIKATKKAIGGFTADNQEFEAHLVILDEGDRLYIFSDGYADTFSGKTGKKLTTKKFKEVLIQLHETPMNLQHKKLNEHIESWKSGIEQVDDILVIGVRF
jgi:serine phosphatase RsbU (regulator of sigma subunit)